MAVTWAEVEAIALAHPGAERGTSYGRADVKLRKRMLVCIGRTTDHVVLPIDMDRRELLLEAQPETFYVTDHYRGWPTVLARLATSDAKQIAALIAEAAAARAAKPPRRRTR